MLRGFCTFFAHLTNIIQSISLPDIFNEQIQHACLKASYITFNFSKLGSL
ncbi:hypothetical protein PCARR_a2079 [Pseudoalteromonas carrageenovora IAM 12662]|uniref:Uncharacterized protein n=1 Tax=Pseudoalteromonas carrageenovora IAM 12662 TaxID=1314868 RepID=A0ABR9ET98_PSEVC|nr:hypothetical protein [Pseudoalteromonas carrageenovora IAM 12662]